MLIRLYFAFVVAMAVTAFAQECRLTSITPAQPANKIEEGERATESQTFQTNALALSRTNQVHYFDSAFRLRRIETDGRATTVAGTGVRGEVITAGPATRTPVAPVSWIAFSPDNVPYFVSTVNGVSRVLRVVNGSIEIVAGSARPGFSGEAGAALEVGLGTIVHIAFEANGSLLIIDGYARVRRLSGGRLVTVAGSTRPAAAAGFTGDNGPASEASLSNPRQLFTFADGSFWIKDLGGRHLRIVTPDGVIRTINQNFESTLNLMPLADGAPAGGAANRVFPLRSNGNLDTSFNPFAPFTGTPIAVGTDGGLYFSGNARPEQRNPLVRLANRVQTVVAGAPQTTPVEGQAPPFAIWSPRTNSLFYSGERGDKFGVVEARAGQPPRFVAGGGGDIADAEGKSATDLSIFGVVAFSIDGEGRIVIADVFRRRILVVGTDGKVSVLKTRGGDQVLYSPLGSFGSLQRIAADQAGNIYWYSQGATPTNGVFTAEITIWNRATQATSTLTVAGLTHLTRLEDGGVAVIAGNGANFRTVSRVNPDGTLTALAEYGRLPIVQVARFREKPYIVAAGRLFRGLPGQLEMLDLPFLPTGTTFTPDYAVSTPDALLVHLSSDGGFYRLENADTCKWLPQPTVATNGFVSAASFGSANTFAPRQLITIFGTGLGPAEGQGAVLDGLLRMGAQPAPYPSMNIGTFTGAIPNATLGGTALPVLFSNDRQMTVQATTQTTGTLLLYFTWQGLQLIYPLNLTARAASPALFTQSGGRDGAAAALNEDGTLNSEANRAAQRSVVQLYATGLGNTVVNPALGDAYPTATLSPLAAEAVVTIGGKPAEVIYAGGAPGAVGLYQINVRLPDDLDAGVYPVIVTVADQSSSQQQVTIAVK